MGLTLPLWHQPVFHAHLVYIYIDICIYIMAIPYPCRTLPKQKDLVRPYLHRSRTPSPLHGRFKVMPDFSMGWTQFKYSSIPHTIHLWCILCISTWSNRIYIYEWVYEKYNWIKKSMCMYIYLMSIIEFTLSSSDVGLVVENFRDTPSNPNHQSTQTINLTQTFNQPLANLGCASWV